jgi:hypothetical protein
MLAVLPVLVCWYCTAAGTATAGGTTTAAGLQPELSTGICAIGGTRTHPTRRITELQHRRIEESRNRRIAELQNCRIAAANEKRLTPKKGNEARLPLRRCLLVVYVSTCLQLPTITPPPLPKPKQTPPPSQLAIVGYI